METLERPLTGVRRSSLGLPRHPRLPGYAVENRRFLRRSVRQAVASGVRQFIAVRTGLPTDRAVRSAVHEIDPQAQVAYVDVDPVVLALRHGLLDGSMVRAPSVRSGLLDPSALVGAPQRDGLDLALPDGLDLTRPVGMLLLGVLHFVTDGQEAQVMVDHLVDSLAPGSLLVISHLTEDYPSPQLRSILRIYERSGLSTRLRSRVELERLLAGLELLGPGVDLVSCWQRGPEEGIPWPAELVACWGAVARVR